MRIVYSGMVIVVSSATHTIVATAKPIKKFFIRVWALVAYYKLGQCLFVRNNMNLY